MHPRIQDQRVVHVLNEHQEAAPGGVLPEAADEGGTEGVQIDVCHARLC